MNSVQTWFSKISFNQIMIFLAVLFVASNLRAPLTSVGPVIGEISEALSLNNIQAGMVTTLPLLCFALLSGIIPKISKVFSIERTIFASLIILSIGLFIRPLGSVVWLFFGASLIGVAITVGNVLMPSYIKSKFPNHIGSMTGIYSVAMTVVAALASGYSIKLGQITQMGWKGSIGIWGVLSVLTLLLWSVQLTKKNVVQSAVLPQQQETAKTNLMRSSLAWAVTLFMGLQSLLFYCMAAWLPKVAQSWGMSIEDSGWLLSYVNFAQLPLTFLGAVVAAKRPSQVGLGALSACLMGAGILGIVLFKNEFILLCCILFGAGSGLAFSLAMLFFVLRTNSAQQGAAMSGMAQSFGYLIAGFGPAIFGLLFDTTLSWTSSFLFMLGCCFIFLLAALRAGRNQFV